MHPLMYILICADVGTVQANRQVPNAVCFAYDHKTITAHTIVCNTAVGRSSYADVGVH